MQARKLHSGEEKLKTTKGSFNTVTEAQFAPLSLHASPVIALVQNYTRDAILT